MTFRMGRSGRLRRCKKATATSYLTSKPIQAALIVIVGERRPESVLLSCDPIFRW